MATKCMSCGGSMKKMKTGGTSNKPCGPGLCRDGQGSCVNCASAKLAGVITTGISSLFANAIGGKMRKNNAAKKKISTAKTEAAQETAQEKRKGGAVKKYAMGGAANKANIPLITNNPRADQGRILKAGGAVNKKFAALAPPYNKATFADRIAGAKKKAGKK